MRKALLLLVACGAISGVASAQTLKFSGLNWTVKSGPNPMGPGPNLFGANQAWVDSNGRLHLRIQRTSAGYACAEVFTQESLGYGTYTFQVERISNMDVNCVLGLFTWDDDNTSPANREIDVEFSRWGDSRNANCQFVVQPYDVNGNLWRFELPQTKTPNVVAFRWAPSSVDFTAGRKGESLLQSHTIVGTVPPGSEKVHLNLWLYGSRPKTPFKSFEVIIDSFRFTPAP